MNTWMNVIKEPFVNGKGDHQIQHQWFCMPYIYVISLSKRADYYLKNPPMLYLLLRNSIQQGGVDALKALKTLYEKAPFLVTVFWW